MKIGGNANASAFFSQYASAGGHAKDVKAKYSSKAANLYKDRLRKLVEEDARKYVWPWIGGMNRPADVNVTPCHT